MTGTVSFECAAKLPNYKTLARSIQRERVLDASNPQSIAQLSIPQELQQSLRGETFLAHDSESADDERLLIFTTEENLDALELNTVWHADGTFKCCPSLFYQVYTIHAVINNHTLPFVYILMQRKSEKQYTRALNILKDLNPCLDPRAVYMDFEKASINAFRTSFPKISINGCFFHFAQANWRKVQELGLSTLYRADEKTRTYIKVSLPWH